MYTSDYLEYAGPHKKTKLQLVDQLVSSNFYVMRALKRICSDHLSMADAVSWTGSRKKTV